MNVLLYVMTILMLLTALTYAKIESYRNLSTVEASFNHYMKATETEPIKKMNENLYDLIKVKTIANKTQEEKVPGTSRLSLHLLINKEERDKNLEAYHETRELFKQLIINLYGDIPKFQEALAIRPNFITEILDELERTADAREGKGFTNAASLSKLKFNDEQLHFLFYLMLNGMPEADFNKFKNDTQTPFISQVSVSDDTTDKDDESDSSNEAEEAHSKTGYASLVDYITLKKGSKIRVYLASPAVLKAIYGNDGLVAAVIEARENLYNQLQADPNFKEEASKQFEEAFSNAGNAANYKTLLNFSISNTNPKKYN